MPAMPGSRTSSDFLSYLRLWDFYHSLRAKLSRNQLRKACHRSFLSYLRMHKSF